jgi:hypothetical protein
MPIFAMGIRRVKIDANDESVLDYPGIERRAGC